MYGLKSLKCKLERSLSSASRDHFMAFEFDCDYLRVNLCLSAHLQDKLQLMFSVVFSYVMLLFGESLWDGPPGFQGTPLFTIVGQCASKSRYGSMDCLPLYSHNTGMVDLSKTRA